MATRSTTAVKASASAILFAMAQTAFAWALVPIGKLSFYTFQWSRSGNEWLNQRAFLNMEKFDRWRCG
jgi:hypothetical protein